MEYSEYLQAIQNVAGSTPGEKFRTLNSIARKIIESSNGLNIEIQVHACEELPKAMIPFVQLEIARVLKKPEGIIGALKSDNEIIFNRALKIKWFFDGSVENCLNADHFKTYVFPYISVKHRVKLIKTLSNKLAPNHPEVADRFYAIVTEMFEEKLARRLLRACSDSFIWEKIISQDIKLQADEMSCIFSKSPALIIEYLKLPSISIYENQYFLSRLLRHHSQSFIELIVMGNIKIAQFFYISGVRYLSLKNHQTYRFLKNEMQSFLNNPKRFIDMLSLEQVSRQLTRIQFEDFYQKILPEKMEDFDSKIKANVDHVLQYLKNFSNDDQLSILSSCIQKKYGMNLINSNDKLLSHAILLYPREEQIKIAREKLENDGGWNVFDGYRKIQSFWVIYLPIDESIPCIKRRIAVISHIDHKYLLLKQSITTCKINNDTNALIEVFKLLTSNRQTLSIIDTLTLMYKVLANFDTDNFSLDYWQSVDNFTLHLYSKCKYFGCPRVDSEYDYFWRIISCSMRYKLKNNQPITDQIRLLTKINHYTDDNFNLFWTSASSNPQYEKICLDEFAKAIPEIFDRDERQNIVNSFVNAIYDFNNSIKSNKNPNNFEKLSINSFPWLHDATKSYINSRENYIGFFTKNSVKELKKWIKKNEPHVLEQFTGREKKKLSSILIQAPNTLKYDSQEILIEWEKYYDECLVHINRKIVRRFLGSCRWYQDIPVKFINKCITDISKNEKAQEPMRLLSILFEVSAFEKFRALHMDTF